MLVKAVVSAIKMSFLSLAIMVIIYLKQSLKQLECRRKEPKQRHWLKRCWLPNKRLLISSVVAPFGLLFCKSCNYFTHTRRFGLGNTGQKLVLLRQFNKITHLK